MSAFKTQMRTLSQAARRVPARSNVTRPARFQRRHVTDDSSPPAGKGPPPGKSAGGFPVAGIVAAVSIPALAWFFMGRSPATADKGAAMKDARRESSPEEEASKRPGTGNEEPSRTVPEEKPEAKATKPANPKAVVPDEQRLGTEKSSKSNTLTGQSK